jgi:hypothetical protein
MLSIPQGVRFRAHDPLPWPNLFRECGKNVRLKQAFFDILKLGNNRFITSGDMKGKKTAPNAARTRSKRTAICAASKATDASSAEFNSSASRKAPK